MNHNVRLALLFTVFFYISQSIATQGVFSAYVYLLTGGSSSKVGYLTGISGLSQVMSAPLFAYLADKHRRDRLLKLSGIIGIVVAIGTAVGIYEQEYSLLCFTLIASGVFNGCQNPAMEALFADSIVPGERSKIFTLKYAIVQIAYAGGPLCSMLMFHFLGNEWALADTEEVIYCGLAIAVLPAALCFFFDDDKAIGGRARTSSKAGLQAPLLDKASETEGPVSLNDDSSQAPTAAPRRKTWREKWKKLNHLARKYYVPVVIAFTDVSFGLASGMSVRFFPLFFMNDCHLSPMAVNFVYFLSPLATSASSFLAQKASRKHGRIHVTICCKAVGVSLLYLLCYLSMKAHPSNAALIVFVWIMRTALMNSTKPLTRSVIMDSAPRKYRAQWNAVESVTMATWSGSAVLGGLLVQRYGNGINNIMTATLQLLSTIPLFFIVHLVPREQDQAHGGAEEVVAVVGSPRGADVVVMDPEWPRLLEAAVTELGDEDDDEEVES